MNWNLSWKCFLGKQRYEQETMPCAWGPGEKFPLCDSPDPARNRQYNGIKYEKDLQGLPMKGSEYEATGAWKSQWTAKSV